MVLLFWAGAVAAGVFAAFHTGDRDPLQWPSVMAAVCLGAGAVLLTVAHWAVTVPAVRSRAKRFPPHPTPPSA